MALQLRANTAVDVLIGPFVDLTDGATAEEGESPSVYLSKNGQALAAKNDATTPTHDDAGYYNCELDATDTNTEGMLVLIVEASANALPVRHEFMVLSQAAWDSLYKEHDAGYMHVNVITISSKAWNTFGASAAAVEDISKGRHREIPALNNTLKIDTKMQRKKLEEEYG